MPVSKDAMARFRIIDRLLADPNKDYTTKQIYNQVNKSCPNVSIRMIQKDIKALEDEFGKEMIRNAGGRGTVRYADQSEPLFYQELTRDEEEVLREVLRSLGQFDGLDNFTWLDLLKKKLEMKEEASQRPVISFSKNEGLQIPDTLLGRLFSAISRKKVIRFTYTIFGQKPKQYTVHPYQLKQFNDRWFLLCSPVGDEVFPFNPEFIANFALDRMDSQFEYVEDEPYVDTVVDLKTRYDEIVGVTFNKGVDPVEVVFAVNAASVNYVKTKYIHITQLELDEVWAAGYKAKYPHLKEWTFFSIECRPNTELFARLASYGQNLVVVSPEEVKQSMRAIFDQAANNYGQIM